MSGRSIDEAHGVIFQSPDGLVVKEPVKVNRLSGKAEALAVNPEYGHLLTLSVTDRSGDRENDIEQAYNEFETGLSLQPPRGFHLVGVTHPDLAQAGYSLLEPIYIFNDSVPLVLRIFKLTTKEDFQVSYPAMLLEIRRNMYFSAPLIKASKSDGSKKDTKNKSKGRSHHRRRDSSSEEDRKKSKSKTRFYK